MIFLYVIFADIVILNFLPTFNFNDPLPAAIFILLIIINLLVVAGGEDGDSLIMNHIRSSLHIVYQLLPIGNGAIAVGTAAVPSH